MPLKPGKSQAVIGHNIGVEESSGAKPKQAIAIALNKARASGARIKKPKRY